MRFGLGSSMQNEVSVKEERMPAPNALILPPSRIRPNSTVYQ